MPYISNDKRELLNPAIDHLRAVLVEAELDDETNNMEGNLNYIITRLFHMVYGNADGTSYSAINDAIGVLECVKQEFYRRVASPYEDIKIQNNGDIDIQSDEIEVLSPITVEPQPINNLDEENE